MRTQIKHAEIPAGANILGSKATSDELYIVLDHERFVALRARPVYDQVALEDIHVCIDPHKGIHGFNDEACIELNIITQDEWDDAVKREEAISAVTRREYLEREIKRLQNQLKALDAQAQP